MSKTNQDQKHVIHMDVDVKDYLEKLIGGTLKHDLHQNSDYAEEICETCHGTGLRLLDNPYGLGERSPGIPMFPYKHQSLGFCTECSFGVRRRCTKCGKLLPNYSLKCECQTPTNAYKIEQWYKRVAEAEKEAQPEEIDNYGMFYCPSVDHNGGYFSDWETFFENFDGEGLLAKPQYVCATTKYFPTLDAANIIENAVEDCYEDASSDVSPKKEKELQDFLDKWIKECGIGYTYYEDESVKVRIPWELDDVK